MARSPGPTGSESTSSRTSAAWTIRASRTRAGSSPSPKSRIRTSKVQRPSRWVYSAPGASRNGPSLARRPRAHDPPARTESRVRVDEPPDQPGAGDAVGFGAFPRDPLHASPPARTRTSGWPSAAQQRSLAELVQAVEQRSGDLKHLLVVGHEGQSPQERVEPRTLRGVVSLVAEVGLVHHLGDRPQHRILQVVALEERLEAAITAVMGELGPPHVEWNCAGGDLVRIGHEGELGIRIDEPADEPRAGRPVDVAPCPRRPLHGATSISAANCSTARIALSLWGGGK